MDKNDVDKLFNLLERLYQGKKKPRDEVTVAIWTEVLKPWSYEQVRSAAIQRARESRYSPDPSELAVLLPKKEAGQNRSPDGRIKEDMDRLRRLMDRENLRVGVILTEEEPR